MVLGVQADIESQATGLPMNVMSVVDGLVYFYY